MNAVNTRERCAHCGSHIVDPTTRVVHGGLIYCCTNCATAMEQRDAGADPDAGDYGDELRCAHCGAPIVDESSMEESDGDAFCCANCLHAMAEAHPSP